VRAFDDVSLEVRAGETLELVGESGSGKTTVGRSLLRLIEPTGGRVFFQGTEITQLDLPAMKRLRRHMQIIFQDPYGSLPPRMRLLSVLREPLLVHGGKRSSSETREQVAHMLDRVGLRPEYMYRFPHEFSGGQRQRIAIARALILHPRLIVADEPVSALDVSIQAQILNLLVRLQKEMELSYLFISHDLSVVKYMADRIAVMYLGKIVEMAERSELYRNPLHPYTRALMSAIPSTRPGGNRKKIFLGGEVPSPIDPPSGCPFHTRCNEKMSDCTRSVPLLKAAAQGHYVACHLRAG
jgi:oligopeptide transport system ATP-binding protein